MWTETKIIRGRLAVVDYINGEAAYELSLFKEGEPFWKYTMLAEVVQDEFGRYSFNYDRDITAVQASYHLTDEPIPPDEIDEHYMNVVMGNSIDVRAAHKYSDITGYLWTDNYVVINNHNIVEEIKSLMDSLIEEHNMDKDNYTVYLHLVISITRKEKKSGK